MLNHWVIQPLARLLVSRTFSEEEFTKRALAQDVTDVDISTTFRESDYHAGYGHIIDSSTVKIVAVARKDNERVAVYVDKFNASARKRVEELVKARTRVERIAASFDRKCFVRLHVPQAKTVGDRMMRFLTWSIGGTAAVCVPVGLYGMFFWQ